VDYVSFLKWLQLDHSLPKVRYSLSNLKRQAIMIPRSKINPFFMYLAYALALSTFVAWGFPGFAESKVKSAAQIQKPSQASDRDPLNLTQKQKEQIFEIQKDANKQMLSVLTSDQKVVLQKSVQANQSSELVQNSLKLTKEQDLKIQSIQSQASQKILAVLTPAQVQTLKSQAQK
jgi:Spy/CpxP family protein refolding chaperone